MILFRPEHVAPILEGRKTQTRRLGFKRWAVGGIHACKLRMFGETFAHIRILGVREERLGDITKADATAEGYGSVGAYLEEFRRIYGDANPEGRVWVIDFELVREAA